MRITVYTNAPECFEDMSEVLRVFYPGSEIAQAETPDAFLRHERGEREGWVIEKYDLQGEKFQWTAPLAGDGWEVKRRRRRSVKQGCYWLLRRVTGKQPPWGSLTGIWRKAIRPPKRRRRCCGSLICGPAARGFCAKRAKRSARS